MFYSTLPAFEQYVHPESRIFLCKQECACCSRDMNGRPFGMVAVSLSTKYRDRRVYFPVYYLICDGCFEIFFNEDEKLLPHYLPKWSDVKTFFHLKHRPSGLAMLSDENGLIDLFYSMHQSTDAWEDFAFFRRCETLSDILETE